jgi:hypothetical protein
MSSIPPVAALSPNLATPVKDPGRGTRAAQEFEAQLIGSLLDSLEKTFAAVPGMDPVAGADDYAFLGTQALSEALAARGGFGIAPIISGYLAAHEGKG